MRLLSLCAGIGVIDYVWSTLLGQEIAGQVEIDPFCQAILKKHWPLVPKKEDINDVTGTEFGPVDLVAGGIPCQPFSSAGRRGGASDDRFLWPQTFRIIQRAYPTWVLIENVARFIPMALDLVSADLEGEGYETRAFLLPACAVGAPHIRERCFIVAHTKYCGRERRGQEWCGPGATMPRNQTLAHTSGARLPEWQYTGWQDRGQEEGTGVEPELERCGAMAHANGTRLYSKLDSRTGQGAYRTPTQRGGGICRTKDSTEGPTKSELAGNADGTADWLDRIRWPELPGKPQFDYEPPRTASGGTPNRVKRVKALGNAIVPQQIYPILKAIVEVEACTGQ